MTERGQQCYICKKTGHRAEECWYREGGPRGGGVKRRPNEHAGVRVIQELRSLVRAVSGLEGQRDRRPAKRLRPDYSTHSTAKKLKPDTAEVQVDKIDKLTGKTDEAGQKGSEPANKNKGEDTSEENTLPTIGSRLMDVDK